MRWSLLLGLVACGTEPAPDAPAKAVDSAETTTDTTVDGACVTDTGGGYPTWAGFAEAFFVGRCASCHAEAAPERFGAPESVVLDSEDDIVRHLDAIERTVLADPTMPPGGGLLTDELARLEQYLVCLRERTEG